MKYLLQLDSQHGRRLCGFVGVATASVVAYVVDARSKKDSGISDVLDAISDQVKPSGRSHFDSLVRLWSIPTLSLESKKSSPLETANRTAQMAQQSSSSLSTTTVEYDFIVLGYGNAGMSAVETLKEQCPRASIAVVDPLRMPSNDSKVSYYQQLAVGFQPPTRIVDLADATVHLKYRHAILVATGSRGAPPPMDLFDKHALNRVIELRPTEAPGNANRPVLAPETVRQIALMSADQGAKVCVLGSGWEALELVSAMSKVGEAPPMLAFGSSGPLCHILPRYLSTAVTKRLRQQGIDVHERSLVRYVSHFVSTGTNVPRMEVHTAKTFDLMDTCRTHVDLMVIAPSVEDSRGTAILPTIGVPKVLEESQTGRTWYQSWSQLTAPPSTPSTLICFTDDGRLAVNAELSAASKIYAAGSVAKYPNSVTGHAQVAGIGTVDGALAGRLSAMYMSRDYHERTQSVRSYQEKDDLVPFASSSFPIFRSDITPYNTEDGKKSSLSKMGVHALVLGRCDPDNMSTHGFWWTNHSDRRITSNEKGSKRTRKVRLSDAPVYGSGIVFYIDRSGLLCGLISWGLPFTTDNSAELNSLLVNRMVKIISSNGDIISGTSEKSLLKTSHLTEESKRLVSIAMEGQHSSKGLHRRLTTKVDQMPNPLYRYTAAKPPGVASIGLLKRTGQTVSSDRLGENLYMKTDDIYNDVASSTRPPTLNYIYPMYSPTWFGIGATNDENGVDQWKDPYFLSKEDRSEQAWKDNEQRARPAKEDPLWLRRGDVSRGTAFAQFQRESFLSNMTSGRFADGSVPFQRRTRTKNVNDASDTPP